MTLALDNTILKSVAACHTQAVLRHVHGLTSEEESAALAAGTAAHEALALWLGGAGRGPALAAFTAAYASMAALVEDRIARDPQAAKFLGRFRVENLAAILDRYFETNPLDRLPFEAVESLIEVAYEVPLDDAGEFIFTGRLDAIVRERASGQLYVLDHKTTGQIDVKWAGGFRLDSQMTGYVWAAEQTLGERVAGVYINGIEFSKLPSSDRKCARPWGNGQQPHGVPFSECGSEHASFNLLQFDRAPWQLESWHETALGLARKYAKLKEIHTDWRDGLTMVAMQGTFHGACKWCQFSEFCAAGRPTHALDTMFVWKPWSPLPEKGNAVDGGVS